MQRVAIFVSFLLVAGARAASSTDEHPVEKVIGLLNGLLAKVKAQANEEEVTYSKFAYWCSSSEKELGNAITAGKENIDKLESTVEAKTNEEEVLTKQIEELGDELLEAQKAGAGADDERTEAAAVYSTADADYASTIKAIEEAITELEAAKPAGFVQVTKIALLPLVLEQLSSEQANLLDSVSAPTRPDMLSKGELADHTQKYKFKSGSVIELLKQLKMKFEDDQSQATKEETNSINAHALAKTAREAAVKAAEKAKKDKEALMGDIQKDLATAKADLKTARDDLEADEATFETTQTTCQMKKSEWEDRSATRENEMKAIKEATKILAEVSGVRTDAPKNPTLPPAPTEADLSDLQIRKKLALLQADDPRARAVSILREEAKKIHSHAFEVFAKQVAAKIDGPFDEVVNMIQKMIFRLMQEQKDEDDHKNWCDLELEKTNSSKTNKEEKIASLEAKHKAAEARVGVLADEMKVANQMVAALEEHMAEAAEIRDAGKQENKKAIKDSKDAQNALAQAIAVLTEFYKKSGAIEKESYEFVQAPVDLPAEPSTWSASYTGVADPKNQPAGIITVLKEIETDFSKMEAESKAQEEGDQKEYEEQMKANKIEKARRAKEAEMKDQEKKRLIASMAAMMKQKKHVSDELHAVETYLKDLQPACVDGDSTYDDRKEARSKEIDALKQAQIILQNAENNAAPSAAPSAAFLAPIKPVVNHA